MRNTLLLASLAFVLVMASGCGGSGACNNSGDTSTPAISDLPVSSTALNNNLVGPATIRHAEGSGSVDSRGAQLKYVHTDPDGNRFALIEVNPDSPINAGFSGSCIVVNGKIVAGIRQGYYNAGGMPDDLHADAIDITQVVGEYGNGMAAHGHMKNPITVSFYAPSQAIGLARWSTNEHASEHRLVAAPDGKGFQGVGPAGRGGAGPTTMQGQGLAFMYCPYIYASGNGTVEIDQNTLATLCHGLNLYPGPMNLPVCKTFAYRMNDGTLQGIPDESRPVGTATESMNFSTKVETNFFGYRNTSRVTLYDSEGINVIKTDTRWFAADPDVYMISYSDMVNLTQMVPEMVTAGYGNAGASGMVSVTLDVPLMDGSHYVYSDFLSGALSGTISDWISAYTFEAFINNQNNPPHGEVLVTITKAD